jgi:hypothetical protein
VAAGTGLIAYSLATSRPKTAVTATHQPALPIAPRPSAATSEPTAAEPLAKAAYPAGSAAAPSVPPHAPVSTSPHHRHAAPRRAPAHRQAPAATVSAGAVGHSSPTGERDRRALTPADVPPEAALQKKSSPTAAPPKDTSGAADRRDRDLAAERAILEQARTALAQRDSRAALAALLSHARRFPQGRLAELREALWVEALVLAGRPDEARARADRFRARYPHSLFLGAVVQALGPDR